MPQKKALIIGAAGFVGRYLSAHIQQHTEWLLFATKLFAEQPLEDVQCQNLDIADYSEVAALLGEIKPDVIFHLAAQSSVGYSWKKPVHTVEINISGTLNVLEAVRQEVPAAKVLLIGSGEEYGPVSPDSIPIKETIIPNPANPYAITKNTQNQFGALYAKAYGMDVVSTRSFNHFGPGQQPTFVVADFCKQVAEIEKGKAEPVIYVGNLAAKRDFTDVRDVVAAYVALAESSLPGETYNVGSGKAVSIQSLLDVILCNTLTNISVKVDPAKFRPVDVPIIEADISKLKKATGWKPECLVEDTIRATLDYWRCEIACTD